MVLGLSEVGEETAAQNTQDSTGNRGGGCQSFVKALFNLCWN
jgi:hypothetical protein